MSAELVSAELETRVLRKITLRIVPFVVLLYFIAFVDRVNIGVAALTMNKDLGFSPAEFGFGAGIFFLGYFLFEVPSNLVLDKVGARIWIARVMITWGFISGAMAFVQGATSFYTLRFLLGVAEAGFFPGIILYLSYWFPARQRAAATAMFMAAAPLSTVLGSPVSGALLEMHGINAEAAKKAGTASHSAWRGLADPRVIALSLVYFGASAGLYTLSIWAPLIIKEFGLSSLQVGFLNALPGVAAVIAMVLWARHSDRSGERTWHVVSACLLASLGLVLAGIADTVLAVLLTLALINIGTSSAKPPLWSMPTMFLSGSAAAAGIATINSIGNLGGFVGPAMIGWIKDLTGSFQGGLFFVAALLLLSAVLTLVLARSQRVPAAAAADALPLR